MTFIEGMCGRAQYDLEETPNTFQDLWGIRLEPGEGFFQITLYIPVELRGVTPLTLRVLMGTIEDTGFTDFDFIAYSFDELTETYTGLGIWPDERWTFADAGSAVEGETLWTDYRDFDVSDVVTADATHLCVQLYCLDPQGGLSEDQLIFLNLRTLE